MRIWLDPNKLHTYGLSVAEVTAAVKAQNAQVAIGQLGGAPSVKGQQLNATINAQTVPNCAWVMSHASNWVPSPTTSSPATTASRPAAWRSPWPPAPTRWTPRPAWMPRCRT
ncbi:hypothetical protein G6F58_013179 [Rhizopus delemar]|nr:hypothetical protein G6F58_013179 [Rhizopus delemar]